ncbi:MAG: hypothetical protein J6T10_26670 [Methanobrevibacter sp.]|nr:hypothetical protein [Methanobrevibacter sp.]
MEKKKRQLHENSLKNLEKGTNFKDSIELARRAQLASAAKRKQNNIERPFIEQEIHNRYTMCDDLYKLIEEQGGLQEVVNMAIHQCIEYGKTKDLVKLVEIIKPSERQDIPISGDISISNTVINVIPVKGIEDGNKS